MIILWFFCFYSCVLKNNNSKKYQKRKTQVLNWRKVGPIGEDENTIALINITQEDESNIFELLQNLWINNLPFPPLLTQPPPPPTISVWYFFQPLLLFQKSGLLENLE